MAFFKKYLLILAASVIVSSCSYSKEDFDFNKDEISFFDAYKLDDTIEFKGSDFNTEQFSVIKIDTSQKKETGYLMARPAYNSISIEFGKISFDSINHNDIKDRFNLVLSKSPQAGTTEYRVAFKNFSYGSTDSLKEYHRDTLLINLIKITDYYLLKNRYSERVTKPYHIEYVIWKKNFGLVAYKYKNGVYYTLVNKKNLWQVQPK